MPAEEPGPPGTGEAAPGLPDAAGGPGQDPGGEADAGYVCIRDPDKGAVPGTAHPARVYDAYLGGKDHFRVDQEAAEQAKSVVPDARQVALANRGFLVRAVRTLAADYGIGQFIDVGTGFPASPNVHEVAQEIIPAARVVYVDNDDVVVAHNKALRAGPGVTAIEGDARAPEAILGDPELLEAIDFTRPAGVLFVAVLHFIPGAAAGRAVEVFRRRLVPGSFIAVSHVTSDGMTAEAIATIEGAYSRATAPAVFRTGGEIEALFGGCWMLAPGVTRVQDWRPDDGTAREPTTLRILGGVGRVPPPALALAPDLVTLAPESVILTSHDVPRGGHERAAGKGRRMRLTRPWPRPGPRGAFHSVPRGSRSPVPPRGSPPPGRGRKERSSRPAASPERPRPGRRRRNARRPALPGSRPPRSAQPGRAASREHDRYQRKDPGCLGRPRPSGTSSRRAG